MSDDYQVTAPASWAADEVLGGRVARRRGCVCPLTVVVHRACRDVPATERKIALPCRVGEQSVVSDSHQSRGQEMQQEAPQEFRDFESHESVGVGPCAVIPAEGDSLVVEGDDTVIGDRDAVGIAAEIAQHLPGSGEGRFGIDDPVLARRSTQACEWVVLGDAQVVGVDALLEPAQELAAEQPAENAHGKQEAGTSRDPASALPIEPSSGDDAMDVRVVQQGLGPGVEHAREPDPGAEIPGVAGGLLQGLGDGGKQQTVGQSGIRTEQGVQRIGYGEDDVVVLDRKQMLLLGFEPSPLPVTLTLGTVSIPAGVVGDDAMVTAIALLDVTTERGGTTAQDGSYHASLPAVEPQQRVVAPAEDVGQLELRLLSTAARSRRTGQRQRSAESGSRSSGLGVSRRSSRETWV